MKWAATLTVAAAAICLSSAQTACPAGWVDIGDGTAPVCMYFVRQTDAFSPMRLYCQAIGGDLAKLTGNLHQLVVDYIKSMPGPCRVLVGRDADKARFLEWCSSQNHAIPRYSSSEEYINFFLDIAFRSDALLTFKDGDLDDETFWIGGSDEVTEGSWKWLVDWTDIPLGPPHWYLCSDQPSGGTKKNFLCLDGPDFYFHSCTGDHEYMGICQL